MGSKQIISALLNEHAFSPITGQFLAIGRSTVYTPKNVLTDLFNKYKIPTETLQSIYSSNKYIDNSTRRSTGEITDDALIASFSGCQYNCLDISGYEGADIIHDMNTPIPQDYHGKYDFIYNGGCMDNMFDPVTCIKNTAKMLSPNGRIVHAESATAMAGYYLTFSPEWFFSYYAINNFYDCKVYVVVAREPYKDIGRKIFDADLFLWRPYFTRTQDYNYIEGCRSVDGLMLLIVVAQKGRHSTSDTIPIQSHYLRPSDTDWRARYEDFCATPRPLLKPDFYYGNVTLPLLSDHYQYLGSGF
ncbi:MAG: class I SAM-dependent methyltransferase [Nitrospirae bacterium YQR-1]